MVEGVQQGPVLVETFSKSLFWSPHMNPTKII